MREQSSKKTSDSTQAGQIVYYIILDDEGIWMMTEMPEDNSEVLFQTKDLFAAERALSIELARCD